MDIQTYKLEPPSLEEIATVIRLVLKDAYEESSVTIEKCPDLRNEPFHLAARGLSGNERVADIGGQPNLFPKPQLSARYSLMTVADQMEMTGKSGMLIGAGAGPFFDVGVNSELAPNISWERSVEGREPVVKNLTKYTRTVETGKVLCQTSPTTNFALMMNLYGSEGLEGPVLKLKARKNLGDKGLSEYIRSALIDHFGKQSPISIGGVFLMRKGLGTYHVMPDFPSAERLPFRNRNHVNDWLTWHEFVAPMICLSVIHIGDPGEKEDKNLELRSEHTHCFSMDSDRGGHYHGDILKVEDGDVEYEGYFNTAKTLYRIDQPKVKMDKGFRG